MNDPRRPLPVASLDAPSLNLDLAATLNCGQVFHWQPVGPGWAGTIGDVPVYLEQSPDDGSLLVTPGRGALAARYLALDHPLAEIIASFPDDPAMRAARDFCRGLRVIRQPAWECLATFITSAMKQVAHIRLMSHTLRRRFGARVGEIGGVELFAYPPPGRIAALAESDLRAAGLGWRAPHFLATAQAVRDGAVDLEAIRALPDAEAHRALCTLPGVGPKVANCVLLFAYERLEAFPIDVWIARVLREKYFRGEEGHVPAGRLREFARSHFGPFGGYAQQYLFHHARSTVRRTRAPRPVRRVRREQTARETD